MTILLYIKNKKEKNISVHTHRKKKIKNPSVHLDKMHL